MHHALSHRRYHFEVYHTDIRREDRDPSPRVWATLEAIDRYPLPRPHLKIVEMLKAQNLHADKNSWHISC